MQQEAVKKISDGIADCKETRVPAEPIAEFIKTRCGEDVAFATLVAQEHKTLEKCFAFVYEQARKHLNGSAGWIADNDVYMMAADYFALDDAELEQRKAEEEKKRAEERKQREANSKRKADEAKEQKAKEAKSKTLAKTADEHQLSLF